ncbi:putative regulator of chromosome condensation 1/beta-lactamase-inhibitor protein II [Plasmopara halstedii]
MAIRIASCERCDVVAIAGGNDFSLFLLQNGTVYISGRDPSVETEKSYLSPRLLVLPSKLGLEFFGLINAISCGEVHYALLSKNGSLLLSLPRYLLPSSDAGLLTVERHERHVVWLKEAGSICRMVCGASHTLVVIEYDCW